MRTICLFFALSLGFGASAEPTHPGFTDTWQFSFGVLNQGTDAKIRSTRGNDVETEIDLDDFGLDDTEVTPQLGVRWRFADRWALTAAYSDYSVSSSKVVNTSFNFNGTVFPLNASLKTGLDIGLYVIAVDYTLIQKDNLEWGVGAGLHAIDLGASFKGTLNNLSVGAADEDFLAPLPNLRTFLKYSLNDRWLIGGTLGWLGADIDDISGSLVVGTAFVDYRLADKWTIGLNYQTTAIDVDIEDGNSDQSYDIRLPGFALTAKYSIR